MKQVLRYSALAVSVSIVVGCSQSDFNKADFNKANLAQVDLQSDAPVTVFVANDLLTMVDSTPENANAVAVQNGVILEVGDKTALNKKYQHLDGYTLDKTFSDKVITPGFIEPHIHLWMSAIFLSTDFVTPADWSFPWGDVKGVQGNEAYFARLNELNKTLPEGEPLFTWGYHNYFHGSEMSRELLNQVSNERPIIVWHRSAHEFFMNDAAIAMLGWQESDWQGDGAGYDQLDWERGHAYENGMKVLLPNVLKFVMESGRFATGLERTKDYVHAGGITTAVDPGVVITPELYDQMLSVLLDDQLPMDYWLIPAGNITYMMGEFDADRGKAIAEAQTQQMQGQEQIQWLPKFVKLFADGAMYSQLMQLKDGYTDGHEGEWLQTPEQLEDSMRPYWNDDYTIAIHANGDLGFAAALDILESLNEESPRNDHRTSFHHLGITDKEDIPRAVESGANFSVNPYYTHVLAELYSQDGVGKERAAVMSRGRSFIDAGGLLSLHSDAPMAPAQPLSLVWAAVNRIGLSGETVMGAEERITVDEAMKAITINAAYTARLEDKVGTIEAGKYADFTVLDANPYVVSPETINQIGVEATVYRGLVAPVTSGRTGMLLNENNRYVLNKLNSHSHSHHHHGHSHHHDHDVCETSLHIQQVLSAQYQ